MPSLAEHSGGLRVALERAAHGAALVMVAWLLALSLRGKGGRTATADVGSLARALERWSTASTPARVHVVVDGPLSPEQRDWLAALEGAGTSVTWEGRGVLAVAAVAEPVADPSGATRVWAAAPEGTTVVLEDAHGVLDSVRAAAAGARFLARSAPAAVRVRAGVLAARAAVRDSLTFGRLLVLGRAAWESKFVVAALEERGWSVDAKLVLSPKGDVVQGTLVPIDTARYAALIALDTSALAFAPQLVSYVRAGGGLVAAAAVAAAPALTAVRVGAPGTAAGAVEPFDSAAPEPRRALALIPIALGADAVPLELRDAFVAVAARRVERGRVTTFGYDDTWRWRMGGGGDAVEAHRAWWAELVAGVAHLGRVPRRLDGPVDEAPLVHLIERLGPPTPSSALRAARGGIRPAWLFSLFAAALLLGWASRRLRGAP